MKAAFNHASPNVMEALGVSRDRMDIIVEGARKKMMKDSPEGTKTQQLDSMIAECTDINEVIAVTIVWVSMTDQMQNREDFNKHREKVAEDEFKNKIMGANPGLKVVK